MIPIQTFRDRKLSLWQSAVEDVVARRAAAPPLIAAAGTWRLAATFATAAPGEVLANRDKLLEDPKVAATTALVAALSKGKALTGSPPVARAAAVAESATAAGSAANCSQLALQLAWARLRKDRHEIERLQDALQAFGGCDPLWAEAVELYLVYFQLDKGSIPYRSGGDYVLDYRPPPQATIALLADWGTGTAGALEVLRQVKAKQPHVLFHLGDIYYSGTQTENHARFLDICRDTLGPDFPVFSLAGNHDMYSGGVAYYTLVDQLKQQASYFCVQNDDWQFLAMDTGYNDFDPFTVDSNVTHLTPTEASWHAAKIQGRGSRKTVLLSHHQLFSAYEPIGGQALNSLLQSQFEDVLGAVSIWFWGHEHLLALYGPYQGLARGRCIGCAAIPVLVNSPDYNVQFPDVPLLGDADGNPVKPGNDGTVYNRAYAIMKLDGPRATVSYYQDSDEQNPLYEEKIE